MGIREEDGVRYLTDSEINKIYRAIANNKLEEIKGLLKLGVKIEDKKEYRYNLIEYAVAFNRLEIVELLLKNKIVDTKGKLLMYTACNYGYKEMVELLIKYQVDINERNVNDSNALYACVYHRNLELHKILVENGGNLEQLENIGTNLLYYAVSENCYDIVKYLLEKGMGKYINDKTYPALVLATHWNYIDLVKLLLASGADIKLKDRLGNTALLESIKSKNFNLVPILLENGADLKEKDKDGKEAIRLLKESAKEIEDMIAKYNKRKQKIKRK